ncbi:MAG TPA: hypothetical protein VK796_11500 [Cytophaga sp.]|jgi:hypothetical protein|nr:hypothetical protein [Cytophaga sp.]
MKSISVITFFITGLFFFQFTAFCQSPKDSVVTHPLPFNPRCFKFDPTNTSNRKNIYDADDYARMQAWSSCAADSFPEVDFSKRLLLYVFYTHSGCTSNIDRKLVCYMDHLNKKQSSE